MRMCVQCVSGSLWFSVQGYPNNVLHGVRERKVCGLLLIRILVVGINA